MEGGREGGEGRILLSQLENEAQRGVFRRYVRGVVAPRVDL